MHQNGDLLAVFSIFPIYDKSVAGWNIQSILAGDRLKLFSYFSQCDEVALAADVITKQQHLGSPCGTTTRRLGSGGAAGARSPAESRKRRCRPWTLALSCAARQKPALQSKVSSGRTRSPRSRTSWGLDANQRVAAVMCLRLANF